MSCLERVYYWSQIVLTVIAFGALLGAFLQIKTSNKFELLKILESPRIREARGLLWRKLRASNASSPHMWWQYDEELEKAAATVCASFDIVGIVGRRWNRRFFTRNWAYPVCWTHEALEAYIKHRSEEQKAQAYEGYERLYKAAKKTIKHSSHQVREKTAGPVNQQGKT
jgi:hypothetical protein